MIERTEPLIEKAGGFRTVALAQAVFYVITGLWSIFGLKSFQRVTGPKVDGWLVKTVGVLVIAVGGVLGMAAVRRTEEPEIPVLATASAAGLTAIDVVYVSRGRISPVYLLDAVAEIGLIGWWALAWRRRSRGVKAGSA